VTLEDVKKTLKTDVAFVANQVAKNQEHVAKNIGLLMTLISVAESRIVIAIGKRIEAPTLAAFLLLPLALVSSVMNINWGLRPDGPKPMSFGFILIPFSAVLGLGYMCYSRSWSSQRACLRDPGPSNGGFETRDWSAGVAAHDLQLP